MLTSIEAGRHTYTRTRNPCCNLLMLPNRDAFEYLVSITGSTHLVNGTAFGYNKSNQAGGISNDTAMFQKYWQNNCLSKAQNVLPSMIPVQNVLPSKYPIGFSWKTAVAIYVNFHQLEIPKVQQSTCRPKNGTNSYVFQVFLILFGFGSLDVLQKVLDPNLI